MQANYFELIKVFIEIVDAGSLTRAAENLQMHRPAVTRSLQQLEYYSGVRLLQRNTRQIYLTPEGKDFYHRSKPLLLQVNDLLETYTPEGPLNGQLRVDVPIALATKLVVPNLPSFYSAHPNIEIELSSSDRRRDLLREGLDCVLRIGELDDSDYIVRHIGHIRMTTCASPEYLSRYGMPETLDDLREHKVVTWVYSGKLQSGKQQTVPWMFETKAGVVELYLKSQLVLDNSETYLAAGLAGIGLLQGLNIFLQPYLDEGRMVEVLPYNPVPSKKLSFLYPHRHLSRKVRAFSDWVETLL